MQAEHIRQQPFGHNRHSCAPDLTWRQAWSWAYPLLLTVTALLYTPANAQQRWFQIEVSVFSNESLADRAEEMWQADRQALAYPEGMRKLKTLLDILLSDSLSGQGEFSADEAEQGSTEEYLLQQQLAAVGPPPPAGDSVFRFIDFARDGFVQLPASESDFQQTNRALERSPDHRLLFHGLWRQAVENTADAIPVYVSGGQRFGDKSELQGSITIRFNDNRDRVVIDTNLWLTEFSSLGLENANWNLPETPVEFLPLPEQTDFDSNNVTWHPIRVYHMTQSREMRSTEFHYLDHPALGVVVTVFPYEVPAQSSSAIEF